MDKHKNNGLSELAFAAITHKRPYPPPIDDNPPLHAFTMSLGMVIGQIMADGSVPAQHWEAAANRICGKKTPQEIIKMIWNL